MPYNMGEYYERVSDYDLEYQSQTEQDVPFWCELVMRYTPRRVLELACGSGRIGLELLHSPGDFQLEGLDIAPEMLAAYRRKLAREPETVQQRVTLHEGDMSDYQLEHKGQFDLIILPFNSIAHLYEIEQQFGAFKNTYDWLVQLSNNTEVKCWLEVPPVKLWRVIGTHTNCQLDSLTVSNRRCDGITPRSTLQPKPFVSKWQKTRPL